MVAHHGGYVGKILRVDLSEGKLAEDGLPDEGVLRDYVGCWGLGLRYLYDMLPPGYSATDPENPMILMTGPLTGLHLPGATNSTIATKNLDTGFTVGRAHSHGSFGIRLKAAGYDGVIVTGASDKPVYLWIHDGKAELRDASQLWGVTDTHQTEAAIRSELGSSKISVAAIGPAGENICAGGMICNDENHNFSHSGVGSIAGSKKLKAIAVLGEGAIPVGSEAGVAEANREFLRHMQMPGSVGWGIVKDQKLRKSEYGGRLEQMGFAGRNFQVGQLPEFGRGWSKQSYTGKPCPRCPIACCYDLEVTTGPYVGYVASMGGGGEVLEAAGSVVGLTEAGSIFYLADLYDHLGLEGSIAGCTIAMAIEAYEKGLITSSDTDGLELRWGDAALVETLARKMAYRQGFGEILARGIKEAAEIIGGEAPSFAVNVKGTGMNLHEWRAVWGVLLGQIVGSGAGWAAPGADCFAPEPDSGYPEMTNPLDHRSKPMEARRTGLTKFVNDSTGLCWFITWGTQDNLRLTAAALKAATGWDYAQDELLQVGERVMQLERAFNVRHGLRPEDDWTVPDRLVAAPADGPAKGVSIKPFLKGMVQEYHHLMGWDLKTGKPYRATLERCGLSAVARDLWG